ncbi:MAG: DUF2029 domain-containing protein [Dehalococcoidia bacterium]|nr:DUF2029 domain-containing protein [Dehalococcoidia bacterium]
MPAVAGAARAAGGRESGSSVPTAYVVAVLGIASAAIYLSLTILMSFLEFFPGPGITLDFVKMLGPDWQANSALLVSSSAALFVFYGFAVYWLRAGERPPPLIVLLAFPVAFAVILSFMYPPMSVDFIHNVSDARTLFVFGGNPMVTPPDAHPFPVGQSYGSLPAPYGPLWFLLLFPVALVGEGVDAALHVLKFYTSLYYLASAVLVYLIARRVTPGRESLALVLYAWNPFIVLRIAGNGHNDVTMLFFVLLALWLLVERRWRFVLPALAAAALIKYIPLLLVPPFLMAGFLLAADRPQFWRDTAIGASLALGLAAISFGIFWEGWATLDSVREQGEGFITSTPLVLREQLIWRWSMDEESASSLARWAGIGTFAVLYAGLLLAFWRSRRTACELAACLALILLAFAVFGVSWYRPWYMIWPLTFLALVPGRWTLLLILVTSISGMLPDIIEQYRGQLQFFREHYLWAVAAPVIVAFVPPAVALVVGWIRTRSVLMTDGLSPATARQ